MRIDAYNQIAQLYGVQNSYNAQKNDNAAQSGSDELSISQTAYDYQTAKAAVSESSDVREDRIADLKARIQSGTYSVSPEKLADKLLEKYEAIF